MTDLTKKNTPWVWDDQEEKAFNGLKKAMVTAPILQLPNFEREFTVTTDASEVSVGAILQQDFGSRLQPICYKERKKDGPTLASCLEACRAVLSHLSVCPRL